MTHAWATYSGRVSYAAKCILKGQTGGRGFSSCFEMFDGDKVIRALILKAHYSPTFQLALRDYLGANLYARWEQSADSPR